MNKRISICVLDEKGEIEKMVPLDANWNIEVESEMIKESFAKKFMLKSEMISVIKQEVINNITHELLYDLLFDE